MKYYNSKILILSLILVVSLQTFAQSATTVIVNCAQQQGTLFRAEKYNNVSGKITGASTRNADYAFMNSKDLHARVMRVWLGEGDVYNPTTNTYNFTPYTDYFNDVSQLYADEILLNFIGSKMIMAWKLTPEQCKPIVKNILIYLKTSYPKIKYIECMNEPDNWGASFTANMVYPYYKMFYQVIKEINTQLNPKVPLQIGGIAIMTFKYNSSWLTKFLDDYASDTDLNKKLDFISYHLYSYKKAPREMYSIRTMVESWLSARGLSTDIPSFVTETGLFPGDDTSGTVEDDALRQAAGMAAYNFWLSMSNKNLPFQWVLRHANYERKDQMVTRPQSYSNKLTPYGNMLHMMSMMKLTKLSTINSAIDANGLGVYAQASGDSTGLSVMCWNYQHTATNKYKTTVNILNLPTIFTGKSIRRRLFKIDQTTSNHYYDIQNCNLSVMADTILANPGNSYSFMLPLMNENSVQFIVLEPYDLNSGIFSPSLSTGKNMSLSPNPLNNSILCVELFGMEYNESVTIDILDIRGRVIYSTEVTTNNIGMNKWLIQPEIEQNGMYMVRTRSVSAINSAKLVVLH